MFTHEMISGFNELELSIYNCVIMNKDRVCRMKIKELAEAAHVSTASVLRFCKKLGCEGFSDFKLRYKEYVKQDKKYLIDDNETNLKNMVSWVDSMEFQEMIDGAYQMLKKTTRIIFVGIGTSGILAKYGARFFCNVGRFSLYVDDPFLPVLQDQIDSTVAIALSESGASRETIYIASQMKEHGIKLMCITNKSESVLARLSDYKLIYHVPEIIVNKTNITTQIPVLYILEALAMKFYNGEVIEAQSRDMKAKIAERFDKMDIFDETDK